MEQSERWEDRIGAMAGAKCLVKSQFAQGYLWEHLLLEKFSVLTTDAEYKVRTQVGFLLKAIMSEDKARALSLVNKMMAHLVSLV